jgi:hypothetical protein
LPTKNELIGRFLGSIQAPLSKLVRTFKAIADALEDGTPGEKPDVIESVAVSDSAVTAVTADTAETDK